MRALLILLVGLCCSAGHAIGNVAAPRIGPFELAAALEPVAPPADAVHAQGEGETATAKGTTQDPAPDAADVRAGRRAHGLWDARLLALDRAFPWLAPAEPSQWISLGITLFALLSLAVHLASRLAISDHLGFGRAAAIAAWIMIAGVVQMAVVPNTRGALPCVAVANAVVMIVLFRMAYELSTAGAGLALFLFGIELGIGFGLLKLVDATLRSIGNTTF